MQAPSSTPTLSRIGAMHGGDDPIASPFRRAGLAPFSFVSTIGAVREAGNPIAGPRSMIGMEPAPIPPRQYSIGGVVKDTMWEHRAADAPARMGMQKEGPCECGGDCGGGNAGCGCGPDEGARCGGIGGNGGVGRLRSTFGSGRALHAPFGIFGWGSGGRALPVLPPSSIRRTWMAGSAAGAKAAMGLFARAAQNTTPISRLTKGAFADGIAIGLDGYPVPVATFSDALCSCYRNPWEYSGSAHIVHFSGNGGVVTDAEGWWYDGTTDECVLSEECTEPMSDCSEFETWVGTNSPGGYCWQKTCVTNTGRSMADLPKPKSALGNDGMCHWLLPCWKNGDPKDMAITWKSANRSVCGVKDPNLTTAPFLVSTVESRQPVCGFIVNVAVCPPLSEQLHVKASAEAASKKCFCIGYSAVPVFSMSDGECSGYWAVNAQGPNCDHTCVKDALAAAGVVQMQTFQFGGPP